jgi:hypothetical protein
MPDKGSDELGPASHLGGCYDTRTPIPIVAIVELLAEAMLGGAIDCHSGISDIWVSALSSTAILCLFLIFKAAPRYSIQSRIRRRVWL